MRVDRRSVILGGASTALSACMNQPGRAGKTQADMILHGGQVLTVDEKFSKRTAVAVKDGKVIATGGAELLNNFDAPTKVDLAGRTLMPGFSDCHVHIYSLAPRAIEPDKPKSIAELQDVLRAKAKELGKGEWITGYGWDEALWTEKRNPTRADLDAAAPDNPVVLTRAGAHSAVANSRAFEAAKINKNTEDPQSGIIERGADGEPSGIIRERFDIVTRLVPPDTFETLRASYINSLKALLPKGITSFHSASTGINDEPVEMGGSGRPSSDLTWRRMRGIYDQLGADLPRATLYINFPGEEKLKAFGKKSGDGDDRVRLGGIGENLVDGGFTGPTAWLLADYRGQPGFRGKGRYSDADLRAIVDACARTGWQTAFHAIGDAAIVQAVNAYASALDKYPRQDHRWFLCHFTIMPPDETMEKMAKHSMMIAQQPNFLYNLEGRYEQTLDDWRLEHNNPVVTPVKKHGIFMAFSSDNLPIDPRVALYAATTRKGPSGRVHGAGEAISREEAIRFYTAHGPHLSWEEKTKGTLQAGKLADMVILKEDPLKVPDSGLLTLNVDATFVGGKLVHKRDGATV
ncbi:MAG TPA: amidohydrolase [Hyphomonadaceae bacterium]|nr:amidohydrolase [Hyphomonadaceae bacterium]